LQEAMLLLRVAFCKSYPENLYSLFFLQTSKKKREYQKKKTFLPCARLVCNAMAQTSGKPNSQAPCWLLPLLIYKALLYSLTFFIFISPPKVPAGLYYFSKARFFLFIGR